MTRIDRSIISREVAKRAQMATLDLDVLDELCQTTGKTRNAVLLTEELVSRRRLLRFGDPVGLVIEALAALNRRGWVVYTAGLYDVPVNIRPTSMGFHVAGYPLVYRDVSAPWWARRRNDDDAGILHAGDRTDFHTHSYQAEGGPIEAMDLVDHLRAYPDHLDLHASAIREMQRERTDMASLREVIMDGLFDIGAPATTNELFDTIKDKRPMSMMDVVAQTWALSKAGELTFKERKGQSGGQGEHHGGDLVDIRLTPFGERNVKRRRGISVEAPTYDRPFIKVTMDDVLEGTGMKPKEPEQPLLPEREKVEVTDRLTAWVEPTSEKVVATQIMAESFGGKLIEDRSGLREPTDPRGYTYRPSRSTSTDGGRHPVGKDMTDPKRHGTKARGGPVTRERVVQPQVPSSLPQVAASTTELPASTTEHEDMSMDQANSSPVTDLETRFPNIWRIVAREKEAFEISDRLAALGMEDLAIGVLEQAKMSDLEKEVIELVKELG